MKNIQFVVIGVLSTILVFLGYQFILLSKQVKTDTQVSAWVYQNIIVPNQSKAAAPAEQTAK